VGKESEITMERMTNVAKVIELVGRSKVGWDDAANNAVVEASKTVTNITGVEVINCTGTVTDGKITDYKANVKVAFGLTDR
jgi:dodecin